MPEMNRPFFLDTTVWIHFFRGAGMILLHDDRHYQMIASVVDLRQQYLKPDNQKPDETS